MSGTDELIVVGGSGFAGAAIVRRAAAHAHAVLNIDRAGPRPRTPKAGKAARVRFVRLDLLTDPVTLPPGRIVIAAGNSAPRAAQPWRLVLDNAITTARLLPALAGRDVTLLSSVEVYGTAAGPLTEQSQPVLPLSDDVITDWCTRAVSLATRPCPPWVAAGLCRELAEADKSGRWVYGLAKRAQELLVASMVEPDQRTVYRACNLFGLGQDRVVAHLARRAAVGLPLVVTDVVRTFLPVEALAEAVTGAARGGTVNAGLAALRLPELANLVLDELGSAAPVRVDPAQPDDITGLVETSAFRCRLGGSAAAEPDATLRSEVRAFVRALRGEMVLGRARDRVSVAGGTPAAVRPYQIGSRQPAVPRQRRGTAPAFDPPLPVVVPPRPFRPDVVATRTQACLESGVVRGPGPWTRRLAAVLREVLQLGADTDLLLTSSGTAALRLAVVALAGPARPGDVAALPSFTFPATGEALVQLGYRLRFCDVRDDTWTLDPAHLAEVLAPDDVRVVVAVDALGAPADYAALTRVCAAHGVPLVADSAPSLGASWQGQPVGTQADAHAFSMSFAKVVSAAGGGGALVLPAATAERLHRPVDWTRSARLDEVAAVAALDLLENLDVLVDRRRRIAAVYHEMAWATSALEPQWVPPGDRHAWVHWVARIHGPDRDQLAAELARAGIGTKHYYSPVLHRHDWAGQAEPAGPLPVTEALGREVLALPMSSEITADQADRIAVTVLRALAGYRQ